jgi:putative membrane protein
MATAAFATAMIEARPVNALAERVTLGVLYVWTVVAIAGFALIRLRPEILAQPAAARFYVASFPLFARGHVLLATAALLVVLVRTANLRWLPAFIAIYGISLGSELAGTMTGLPFGPYSYTALLGWKWFDHVPALIPLSWFYMVVPSYALAAWAGAKRPLTRIAFASLVLLAWDLALDPAMSGASSYWIWGEPGPYYGMPLLNLVGWYATGFVLAAVLEVLRAWRWLDAVPVKWLAAFYGANLLLPMGLAGVAGMWGAVLLTTLVVLVFVALAMRHRRDAVFAR